MRFLRRLSYYLSSLFRIMFNFDRWPSVLLSLVVPNKHKTQVISLRHPLLKFISRGGMDIWSIKETILDNFYVRYGVPIQDGWTVLDVGAGIGDFSILAAYGNPETTIFAYEPFNESYQLLVRNINLNGFENILPFNAALWGDDGTLMLDTSSGEPLKFMSMDSGDKKAGQHFLVVEAVSLEKLFDQHGINQIDIMKLDCEGAEYEILKNTSDEVFNKINRIIMEYHDIDREHHHDMLVSLLKEMNYEVTCYDNFVHKDIGYLFAQRKMIQ